MILLLTATLQASDEPKTVFPLITLKQRPVTKHKLHWGTMTYRVKSVYNIIVFNESCYTSISNRTTAIHYRPKGLVATCFPAHTKLSKLCQCAKVTHFFKEKSEDLQRICSWHVSLHLYHLNKFAGRVYLKLHLLLTSHSSPLLWFQLPVCPSSSCSERMMDISAGYLKTEMLVNHAFSHDF